MKLKKGMEAEYAEYVANNSKDGYSKAVVTYSEEWARLMEESITAGRTVAECAKEASHAVDTEGITGFMYGCAVQGLSHFWEHGDALRSWHNREYLPEEKAVAADARGAVVNPAVMTIG